jgi:hypothetical protein
MIIIIEIKKEWRARTSVVVADRPIVLALLRVLPRPAGHVHARRHFRERRQKQSLCACAVVRVACVSLGRGVVH